jgi:hypothetical protein
VLLVVPGLILITIWSVAAPVVVLERPQGLAALGRSRELVRGNGWQVFAVIFVLGILVTILASALDLAAESAGTGVGLVVRVVVGVLTAPLSALAAAVLYFDLRTIAGRGRGAAPGEPAQPQDGQAPATGADGAPTAPDAAGPGASGQGATGLEVDPREQGADPFGRG